MRHKQISVNEKINDHMIDVYDLYKKNHHKAVNNHLGTLDTRDTSVYAHHLVATSILYIITHNPHIYTCYESLKPGQICRRWVIRQNIIYSNMAVDGRAGG